MALDIVSRTSYTAPVDVEERGRRDKESQEILDNIAKV